MRRAFTIAAGVEVMGPVHGLVFVAYCALVVLLRAAEDLSLTAAVRQWPGARR